MRRFEQECQFLSTIRHPNVVQYLGIYQDPDTGLTVLLMELMDDNLTHFLENSTQPIPYHIQVNICHDVALALSFLHSNDIVHRDLSSNNVLLIGNVRAKVTDFGMARLRDRNPRATYLSFTICPGTDAFMPPEAVQDRPDYTEKIDCFSFGVITLQILTRKFPKPGDRAIQVEITQPGLPSGTVADIRVPEVERRQNHINEVDPNHTLLHVTLDCLKDKDIERPSAQQLCERVSALKECQEYSESVRAAHQGNSAERDREERERELRSLRQEHCKVVQNLEQSLRQKDMLIAAGQQEVEQLRQQHAESLRQKDEIVATSQQEMERLRQQHSESLRQKDEVIAASQQEMEKMRQQRSESLRQKDKIVATDQQEMEQLRQQQAESLRQKDEVIAASQQEMERLRRQHAESLRQKDEVIAAGQQEMERLRWQQLGESEHVIAEFQRRIDELEQPRLADLDKQQNSDSKNKDGIMMTWRKEGQAPFEASSSDSCNAVANGATVYIGTCDKRIYAYSVGTFTWSRLPDSPTNNCSLVIINNLLTLVGGKLGGVRGGTVTNKLFTFDLTDEGSGRKWTDKDFPPKPKKLCGSTALHTETVLIVAGGSNNIFSGSERTVEVMDIETLHWSIASDLPQPLYSAPGAVCGDHVYILSLKHGIRSMYTCSVHALVQSCKSRVRSSVWRRVAAPPVIRTTCVSINGRLHVIGGFDSIDKSSEAVYVYDPATDSWKVTSHMATARSNCFAAVLTSNQLVVVGGWTGNSRCCTDSVEIAFL